MISGISIGKRFGVKGSYLQKTRLMLHRLGYLAPSLPGSRSYEILKELPERHNLWKEYCKQFYTGDLGAFVEDACFNIQDLACEMEEWLDNLEGSGLREIDVANRVQECSDLLQDQSCALDDLTMPDSLTGLTITVPIPYDVALLQGRSRNIGRGKRLANALAALEQALAAPTDEMLEGKEVAAWVGELQGIYDELQDVEFPGAYG